jgi:general secretion pathway protein K
MSRTVVIAHQQRQRGAALLMAMIIVALVATLSVSMVWQQWRAVQVEAAERARAQSAWVLAGALDWARIILKEDMNTRGSGDTSDNLGEPWAVPLAEARLSTFLAADKDNTEGGPEAFLSGAITDAQARYNLLNLIDDEPLNQLEQLKVLQRLCDNVGVSPEVAAQIAVKLRSAQATTEPPKMEEAIPGRPTPVAKPPPDGPLMPKRVDQLAWLGIAPQALRRLEPYIFLLPDLTKTKVNVNTASREVLAAVIPGLDLGGAERLIQIRQRSPFKSIGAVQEQLGASVPLGQAQVDVKTSFFVVTGRLRIGDQSLEQRSLVRRVDRRTIVPITRDWVTTREEPATN